VHCPCSSPRAGAGRTDRLNSRAFPDRVSCLVDAFAQRANLPPALIREGEPVSFPDLAERSAALAGGFSRLGIRRGDIVLLWMANAPAWLETMLACGLLGASVFAVNTRFRAGEVAAILRRTGPRAVVFDPRFRSIDFSALIDEAVALAGCSAPIRIAGGKSPASDAEIGKLVRSGPGTFAPTGAPDDPLVLFTTSGTTAAPKYVVHPQRTILAHAADVARGFGYEEADAVLLQALPYCGVFGFCQAMGALAAGRPSVVQPAFDGAEAASLIARHRVTHFNATDDMLQAIVDAAELGALGSLRLVGAASFNRGPDALAEIAAQYGVPVVGLYGMSEVQALFARRALEDPPERRFAGGGRPVGAAADIRVRHPETGALCGAGEPGEIELCGAARFAHYHGDAEATRRTIDAEGYVRTGDLGRLDGDGGFTFHARMGDVLRLGGYLVNPEEISAFIAGLDGVAGCQVVGIDVDGRQRPVAFVTAVPGKSIDTDEVLAACRSALATFKVPISIHAIDEFPYVISPNGTKIQRNELRILAQGLTQK
jgi:fatty-acyl-CoA synthase